uniref:Uncharacterized protein n=1 Tax=Triticum urartu TaxID=4572 RepID=A0A8R7USW6_TRIUA
MIWHVLRACRQGRDGRLRGHRPLGRRQGADAAVLHRGGRRRHRPGQARPRRPPRQGGGGSCATREHGPGRPAHGAAARPASPAGGHGLRASELRQNQNRVDEKDRCRRGYRLRSLGSICTSNQLLSTSLPLQSL